MRKLKYILLLLIAISCTKEVEVLNPVNAENVKKIAELQSQLSSLTSLISGLESQNQNLTNERNNLVEQLSSLQSQLSTLEQTNLFLESEVDSLRIKVAELALLISYEIGVKDGIYDLINSSYFITHNNDLVYGNDKLETDNTSELNYGVIENGVLKKRTFNLNLDINSDSSNKINFKQWKLGYGITNIETKAEFKDTIYVSGVDEIIIEFQFKSDAIINDDLFEDALIKEAFKWKLNRGLSEDDVPAQTFLEINKFITENATNGTFTDPIYKNIDVFDPISLREGFILDAQRNGLDISYLRDENISIETVDWGYGAAYGSPCRSGVIELYLENDWEPVIDPLQNIVLIVMFHEMGHSALNLDHNTINEDIMYPSVSMKNLSLVDIREKTRRMFQNIEQVSFDCGFATQKGGGKLIVN